MADIVQQSGRARGQAIFGINLITLAQPVENARDEMGRAEAVRKA